MLGEEIMARTPTRPIGRWAKDVLGAKKSTFCDGRHSGSAAAKLSFNASPEGGNRERELIAG
jgi:hypothetical protein